jgi:hypothetical protein
VGSANIEATRNYRGAVQVHLVAESAITEALQIMNGAGVIDFQDDAPARLPGGSQRFEPLPGFTYVVTAAADAANPVNAGRLVGTASGPNRERNVVVANVVRSNFPLTAPGVVYLATDSPTNSTFQGNAFTIDGSDHTMTGQPGTADPIPGIATRNEANTQEALASLSGQQKDNIQGLGFLNGPPTVPSIQTIPAAPTVDQVNQFIEDLLQRPGVVTVPDERINGDHVYGTVEAPQITHLTAEEITIRGNGNVEGAGVLIVEGDLILQGSLTFRGLVLVRGRTSIETDPSETTITGNATFYGSMWTNDLDLRVGGSAVAMYSSEALSLANAVGGGGALPAPLQITSIADCSQLRAGVGGCP